MFSGSVIGHVNKLRLNNYEIAIPENIETIKQELEKLYQLHNRINEKDNEFIEMEKDIKNKINEIEENE